MKESYDKKLQLRCAICGGTHFEFNDDKTWIKCNRCNSEYKGGYDELKKENQQYIDKEIDETKKEILEDIATDIKSMWKDVVKKK